MFFRGINDNVDANIEDVIFIDVDLHLDYVKNYLRIDNEKDDEFLLNAIKTASSCAEKIAGRTFGKKEYKVEFYIRKRGLLEINYFKWIHDNIKIHYDEFMDIVRLECNMKKISTDDYYTNNGCLYFKREPDSNVVDVFFLKQQYKVPEDIKQAILFHVADIYQNKNGNCQVPPASKEIYNWYRKIHI